MLSRIKYALTRLHVRLLLVNAVVLLVPVAGLEFARIFERELLASLERDMRHQAVLVRRFLEASPEPFAPSNETVLEQAARDTRTRVRLLDRQGSVQLDSHRNGPPEGEEPPSPRYLLRNDRRLDSGPRWSALAQRQEVVEALRGQRSAFTRIRQREPNVFLFVSEPLFSQRQVAGVVYITRSTRPVLLELYRIRAGLQRVLLAAFVFTAALTLWLAYSITRPLRRLSGAAKRIAAGETGLAVPISGSGELRELSQSFATMTLRLEQRLNDTRAFAADVAHGFKSPLTSLRGAAELLAQGAADDPRARGRFLRNIELDAERLDRLVSRLLELSRVENSSATPQPVALRALLSELVERATTPDVDVTLSCEVTELEVSARKVDLATALTNLLDNAVRASPPGCPVHVSVSLSSGYAEVRVHDAGPGVPHELVARLFERFFTTDGEHGTGLGLAIVRAVAHSHGGSITLDNPGQPGACFCLSLPVNRARRA